MEEAPTMKRKLNSNKSPKQTTPQEMEHAVANQDKSPPRKKETPSKPSMLESANVFEATTSGASREVNMLFSRFAEALSERAAADTVLNTTVMEELDGLLRDAQNLESYLKEMKNNLKQILEG